MIEHSLHTCDDPLFRNILYRWLLGDDIDELVNLQPSVHLEHFLQEKDPDVLYT